MEFMNRSGRPAQASTPAASSAGSNGGHRKKGLRLGGMGLANVVIFVGTVVLVASLALLFGFGRPATEASRVKEDKMQAVFLNGGQVYFGNIRDLNGSHIRLSNIYYLRVNQQVQPNQDEQSQATSNDISLVKLGCELHGPEDEMLINREQVIFWENLKDDGQVAEAVAEYVKQNPNGQDCDAEQQQSTQPAATNEEN